MYIQGYLQGSENGRVVTIAISCGKGNQKGTRLPVENKKPLLLIMLLIL